MNKDSVKQWMDREGRTREWLAKQCNVSAKTVSNWLTTDRSIPSKAVLIIERLMSETPSGGTENVPGQNLVLSFNRQDFDAICDAALSEGKRPNQWAEETLREIANEDVHELAKRMKDYLRPSPPPKKKDTKAG